MNQSASTVLPFSQACENNRVPILAVLQTAFADSRHVLEIGSGTGQHSVYFAPRLPHLVWQTSDLPQNHPGIAAWHAAHPASNLRPPLRYDLQGDAWPTTAAGAYDAVFSSNTAHIMAWPLVQRMFAQVGQYLCANGRFALYGPFNYGGDYTSESNRSFDLWLRERDARSGIRHFEDLVALALQHGLALEHDHAMPANNRILLFTRQGMAHRSQNR